VPFLEKSTSPLDMVIFENAVFGKIIGIGICIESIENKGFSFNFPFWDSQKCRLKIPKNDAFSFLGSVFGKMAEGSRKGGCARMRKKNFKGRCEKRVVNKCVDICRTYDPIQYVYADLLAADDTIQEFRCNVLMDGLDMGEYTTDFVCTKVGGDLMVRECVYRKFLTKPMTIKLLDASREYWLRHGVADWGLVIDEEA